MQSMMRQAGGGQDERRARTGGRASVPPESASSLPGRLRRYAQQLSSALPADVREALLDAANEIDGDEETFAAVVEAKRDMEGKLAQTESNLRGAYDVYQFKSHPKS